jgi:hypothetical protein
MINNPAFELLRKHKQVTAETENLVLKQIRNKVTSNELFTIFENGISGKYGKLYSADVQTLIGWVDDYLKSRNSPKNYLQTGLAPVTMSKNENWDWNKEANKCYAEFLRGTHESNFHPCVYDNMMLAGKIQKDSYLKFYKGISPEDVERLCKVDEGYFESISWVEVQNEITKAKQTVIKNLFSEFKLKGYETIYFL